MNDYGYGLWFLVIPRRGRRSAAPTLRPREGAASHGR